MRRMLKFICSLYISLIFCVVLQAQDSMKFERGVFFGIDLLNPTLHLINPEKETYELFVETRLTSRFAVSFEIGNTTFQVNKKIFSYQSEGQFYRIGAGYNILKLSPAWNKGMLSINSKWGYTSSKFSAPDIVITNDYWGDYRGEIPTTNFIRHWFEISGNIKAEIYRNLYLGWTLRFNLLIPEHSDKLVSPYYIPGYGKASFSTYPLINYYLIYFLPIGN